MSEGIRFASSEEQKERKIFERLQKEGGIFYEEREEINPETNEKEIKRYINILGVELETYASKEDIEALKKETVLSGLDQKLLRTIAECYKLRQPLMFEGDPGVGKTFLMKKFVQLIHGKEAPILELVGTPRTSELEILGHWAPKGLTEKEEEEYRGLLKSFMETSGKGLSAGLNQKLNELNQKFLSGEVTQEQFQEKFGELMTEYVNLFRSEIAEMTQVAEFVKPETEWEFKEGALLQAYSGREGRGYILIVDEFNLIPSNYQQIFLQIGGEKGALSDSISFWGNTGRTIYPRGKDTWICFASNFPEKTPGRSEVVAPMTDRLVWKSISSEETERKKSILITTAGGRLTKRQKELTQLKPEIVSIPVEKGLAWDKVLDEKLGEAIANFIDLFDQEFVKQYQEIGDSISIKGEKRRRIQQFEFSGRNPLRVYSYLDHFQVRDPESGRVDIGKTLENAIELYYISRLVDEDARERMRKIFQKLLGPENIEAFRRSEDILESGGRGLPPGAVLFEGEIISRKELFDILVERASVTEEEKKKIEEQKKEELKRKLEQVRYQAEDTIESLLKNPNIIQDKELKKLADKAQELFSKGEFDDAEQTLKKLLELSRQKIS